MAVPTVASPTTTSTIGMVPFVNANYVRNYYDNLGFIYYYLFYNNLVSVNANFAKFFNGYYGRIDNDSFSRKFISVECEYRP